MRHVPFDAVLVVAFGGPQGPAISGHSWPTSCAAGGCPPDAIEEVARHYERFGGVSPLTAITKRQAEGLRTRLAAAWCRPAGLPRDAQLASAAARHSARRWRTTACVAPSASSARRIVRIRAARNTGRTSAMPGRRSSRRGCHDVAVTYVGDWHAHDGFVDTNARHIRAAIDALPKRCASGRASCSPRTAFPSGWPARSAIGRN